MISKITFYNKAGHVGKKSLRYIAATSMGGGGAATGVGEGGYGESVDVAEDQDESSLGLTSFVSPTGYSLTRGLRAAVRCIKATFIWAQFSLLTVSLSIPKTIAFSIPTRGLDST